METELIIPPGGPFAGRRWRADFQPYAARVVAALDEALISGRWNRVALTAGAQTGKTFIVVALILYVLFELNETVIFGVPTLEMAEDKWQNDILPVLSRTRYAALMPRQGAGSRAGQIRSARQFANGATLRFMTGGGGDAKRSGYTARVVVITEADKLDRAALAGREADRISQIEARADAWGDRRLIVMESTPTVSQGRIWRELTGGTDSRIVLPCPHCGALVLPDAEQLVGWQDAADELAARAAAAFACPGCGATWTEAQRVAANHAGQLEHRQTNTRTLGIRWSAVHNLFTTTAEIAGRCWRQEHAPGVVPAEGERAIEQLLWGRPKDPPSLDLTQLDEHKLARRTVAVPRGIVPATTRYLAVGVDVGLRLCNWVTLAIDDGGSPHVVDYAVLEVPSERMDAERAIYIALQNLRDLCQTGWPIGDAGGPIRRPDLVLVDSGNWTEAVYAFAREVGPPYYAAKGRGVTQGSTGYRQPRRTGSVVVELGNCWHVAQLAAAGVLLVEFDSDAWKSWVHERCRTPLGEPGGLTLYQAPPREHLRYAMHLIAETQHQEYLAGRGFVTRWHNPRRRPNHYLDATAMAAAAGSMCGARLTGAAGSAAAERSEDTDAGGVTMPDGRPFLVTERATH